MSNPIPSLPSPGQNQAYCEVSALEGGSLQLPCHLLVSTAKEGETLEAPALGFLITHVPSGKRLVFDLGIRKDLQNSVPTVAERGSKIFKAQIPQDIPESLEKGGIKTTDVTHVCLSHCHWDHVGNPALYSNATFIVGADTRELFQPGYPEDPYSPFPSDLLPKDRTGYLDTADWKPLGPFPRAFDIYGDGSLYIIDAPGHVQGHVNLLSRTSPDGGWLYLAGDSAHDWRLIRGESDIAVLHDEHHGRLCMHRDKEQAEATIRRIADVMKLPRVQVILAHDAAWYEKNKGGNAFWPGNIPSL